MRLVRRRRVARPLVGLAALVGAFWCIPATSGAVFLAGCGSLVAGVVLLIGGER